MYGDRAQMRAVFFRAWEKFRKSEPLEGVEQIIVQVALQHPEYHATLEQPETRASEYVAGDDANPFLHMGLHIAIEEQLSIDRPPGVRALYERLRKQTGDDHAARHRMLDCLAEIIWDAQRAGRAPDDRAYLDCLQKIAGAV